MLINVLIGLAVLVALALIFVAARPTEFQVARSGRMTAPPAKVFEHVNDFHKWEAWSPWEKIDPALQRTFAGPTQGVGANYKWVGNKNVGEGQMTITESLPSELVRIRLEFLKPFAAVSDTVFTFRPEGNETVMNWTMNGRNNFIAKAMCLFMNMDKMIGGQFEKGLANMKALVEGKLNA